MGDNDPHRRLHGELNMADVATRPADPKYTRRQWQPAEEMRAAQLAALGHSCAEIAEMIGGVSTQAVRYMLRKHGIAPVSNFENAAFILVKGKDSDKAALEAAAAIRGREPGELATLIIRRALEQRGLVDELVKDLVRL